MTHTRRPRRTGRVFIISAPSGAGKTTLITEALRRMPQLTRSVSVATRPRRSGERDRRDYYFVSPARFKQYRRQRQLLEAARVHQHWYGTRRRPVEQALRRGRDVLLNIDVQGARQVRRQWPSSVLIFILPPSMESLRRRLQQRRTEPPAEIRARLALARRELRAAAWYDYAVVNDDLQRALGELQAIIIAEHCRVQPRRSRTQTHTITKVQR